MNNNRVENKIADFKKTYLQQAQKKCWHHQYLYSKIMCQISVLKAEMRKIIIGQTSKCHDSVMTDNQRKPTMDSLGFNYGFTWVGCDDSIG